MITVVIIGSGNMAQAIINACQNTDIDIVGIYSRNHEKSFEIAKKDRKRGEELIGKYVQELYRIAHLLKPFMPQTSEKIEKAIETKKSEILFPKLLTS